MAVCDLHNSWYTAALGLVVIAAICW